MLVDRCLYLPLGPLALASVGLFCVRILRIIQAILEKKQLRFENHHISSSQMCWVLVHPWSLTWNLKMAPWKRRSLFKTIIFRFYVKLWVLVCGFYLYHHLFMWSLFAKRSGKIGRRQFVLQGDEGALQADSESPTHPCFQGFLLLTLWGGKNMLEI